MNRNGLPVLSDSAPSRTDGALQNFFSASLAWRDMRDCS